MRRVVCLAPQSGHRFQLCLGPLLASGLPFLWLLPNGHRRRHVAFTIRCQPSFALPPNVHRVTGGAFCPCEFVWKGGEASRVGLDACRHSATGSWAPNHHEAHCEPLSHKGLWAHLEPERARGSVCAAARKGGCAPTLAFANVRSGPLLLTLQTTSVRRVAEGGIGGHAGHFELSQTRSPLDKILKRLTLWEVAPPLRTSPSSCSPSSPSLL
jgi:hypothetical protein